MAGPYDYTINIPQPPAQNFLQSLLGIQQLRQMQEQSALQQQQAAFAQQQQPLQLQHLQEQINASKAAQAHSAAATGLLGTQTEAAKFDFEQKQKQQTALNDLASDPSKWTQDNFMKLGIQYPQSDWINLAKMRAALPTKALNFGDSLGQQLVLSTQIGDTETAQKLLDDAVKVSKEDPELQIIAPKIEQLSKQYRDFPEQTSTIAAMGLQMLSPDRAKAMFAAMDERLKSEETQAKIDETKARATKEQWAAVKMSQEVENGKPMSRSTTTIVDAATSASQSYGNVAERAQSLLTELNSLGDIKKGLLSRGEEAWKSAWGDQDAKSNYLTGFDSLVNSDLFKTLKENTRGSMNVQELKVAGGTVPGKYDSPKRQAEYLDAIISAFNRKSQLDSDKANFVSVFNTNGKAPKDGEVSGVAVKQGTTLNDFLAQRKKELGGVKVFGGAVTEPTAPSDVNPIEAEFRRRGLPIPK